MGSTPTPTPTPTPSPDLPPPTPTPEPTPTPAPTPDGDVSGSSDAATTALADTDKDKIVPTEESDAGQLMSTALTRGLPPTPAADQDSFFPDGKYVNFGFFEDWFSAATGQDRTDPFSGVPAADGKGTEAANPFGEYKPGSPDTSQYLASNDSIPIGSRSNPGNGTYRELVGVVADENGTLHDQYAVYVNNQYSGTLLYPHYERPIDGPTFNLNRTPDTSLPPPSTTPPTNQPTTSSTQANARSVPPAAAPSLPPLPAPSLPPLPAPAVQAPTQASSSPPPAQTASTPPARQPDAPRPTPSFTEQAFPRSDSFSWRQYEWAGREMLDPTNPWYGRFFAGLGFLASSIWAGVERFVVAPVLKGIGQEFEGLNMMIDDFARFVNLDRGAIDLYLWERESPAMLGEALTYLGMKADLAIDRALTRAFRAGYLPVPGVTADGVGGLGGVRSPGLRPPIPRTSEAGALPESHLPADGTSPWSQQLEDVLKETEQRDRIDRLLDRVNLPDSTPSTPSTPSRLPGPLDPPMGGDASWRRFNTAADGTRTLDAILNPSDLGQRSPGRLPSAPGYEPGLGYDRSHLGMRAMGFPNTPENSVTLAHEANAYGAGRSRPVSMLDFERQVIQALNDGQTVRYRVTALFNGNAPNPEVIIIQATGSGPDGINIDTVIRNWTHH